VSLLISAPIQASHRALDEITRGNAEPFFELYGRSDDATSPDVARHYVEDPLARISPWTGDAP
jgi:hypothetical protein